VSEQVDDQGMRDGKGGHTIGIHVIQGEGCREDVGRGEGMATNTSKVR